MNFNLSRFGKVLAFGLVLNFFPGCTTTTPDKTTKDVTQGNYFELETEAQFNTFLAEKKVVLAKFYATWCPPCGQLAPVVKEVAKELEDNDDLAVISINIDKFRELVGGYGIMSVPAMLVFKNGEKVKEEVGVRSKDEIKGWLEPLLAE